jgi:predicted helicase
MNYIDISKLAPEEQGAWKQWREDNFKKVTVRAQSKRFSKKLVRDKFPSGNQYTCVRHNWFGHQRQRCTAKMTQKRL